MTQPLAVASPCINICRMDEASGWCEGCLRTLDEIAAWGGLDEPAKRAVLRATSARRPRWRELRRAAGEPVGINTATPKT